MRELLVDTAGDCHYQLRFGTDRDDRGVITGRVSAELHLRCQRCCGAVTITAYTRPRLILVEGLDEAARLPDDAEPLLIATRLIRSSALIEEELLLEIPAVPRHAEGECEMPRATHRAVTGPRRHGDRDMDSAGPVPVHDGAEEQGPFSVLRVLRGRQDERQGEPDPTVGAPSRSSRRQR
ncbi:MAG: YceD family protein [Thiohalocapsa sp.]